MTVRITWTPPRWPQWRRKPALTLLNLRGAAEIANLRDRYPGALLYAGIVMETSAACPRNGVMLVNIGMRAA